MKKWGGGVCNTWVHGLPPQPNHAPPPRGSMVHRDAPQPRVLFFLPHASHQANAISPHGAICTFGKNAPKSVNFRSSTPVDHMLFFLKEGWCVWEGERGAKAKTPFVGSGDLEGGVRQGPRYHGDPAAGCRLLLFSGGLIAYAYEHPPPPPFAPPPRYLPRNRPRTAQNGGRNGLFWASKSSFLPPRTPPPPCCPTGIGLRI